MDDLMDKVYQEFLTRVWATKEKCILDAMSKGIDLHEMGIQDSIRVENGKMVYTCRAVRLFK